MLHHPDVELYNFSSVLLASPNGIDVKDSSYLVICFGKNINICETYEIFIYL